MQTPDHPHRESSFSVQNIGDASARANDLLQVRSGESLLLHTEFDRLNRVRRVHRIVFSLIGINERCEDVQSVAIARSRLRAPKAFNLLERGLIIPLGPDRLYLTRHAAPLSRQSYRSPCACRST